MAKKFEAFTPEINDRLAAEARRHQERMSKIPYIKGKPELFETKVLRIVRNDSANVPEKNVLVATRDPGSGNALTPVLKKLADDQSIQINIMTDGLAEEIMQDNFSTQDITPAGMVLEADSVIGTPDVILHDRSSETGIDSYVAATFPEVPKILVEDYYGNAVDYLSDLKSRELSLPEKICVMDQGAKDIITKRFPDLEGRIVITGQPAFDKFAHEDTADMSRAVRQKLNVKPEDKIVTFMSAMDEPEKIRKMAEALQVAGDNFYFIFRRHPRDRIDYETYRQILTEAGINSIDTDGFTTDEISAASDVIMTTWSSEGLYGIYRRKPTIHITDIDFGIPSDLDLPLVPVKLKASIGINHMDELAEVLPQLLDSDSRLCHELQEKMQQEYPVDGNNAQRVSDIVRGYLGKKQNPDV